MDRARLLRIARRWSPWLVGIGILGLIAARIPYAEFRDAIARGPQLALALFNAGLIVAVLAADAVATWLGLLSVRMKRPFLHVVAVRGATYVLYLINYAIAQGAFGYYLRRSGATTVRAVGATLYLMGTNLATLLVMMAALWLVPVATHPPGVWGVLVAGNVGFAIYLVAIAWAPAFLTRVEVLAPLFDARLRGHAIALAGRIPHIAVMILGYWFAMEIWGIHVPFSTAVAVIPAVIIASVLPIAPAGLGTTQLALVYFFADHAPGAQHAERAATTLAFSIVHLVYGVVASALVGLLCIPFARRIGAIEPRGQ